MLSILGFYATVVLWPLDSPSDLSLSNSSSQGFRSSGYGTAAHFASQKINKATISTIKSTKHRGAFAGLNCQTDMNSEAIKRIGYGWNSILIRYGTREP